MNRTIPALITALALPLALAACGSSPEEEFIAAVEEQNDIWREQNEQAAASAAAVTADRAATVQACLAAGDCSAAIHPGNGRPLLLEPADVEGTSVSGTRLATLAGDFSGLDLSGAVLTGLDLSGSSNLYHDADLSGADLTGADLSQVDLSGANLTGADLSQVDLSGADLTGADLTGADLTGANIGTAKLSSAVGLIVDSPAAGTVGIPAICTDGTPAPMANAWELAAESKAEVPVLVIEGVMLALAQQIGPCGSPTADQLDAHAQRLLAECQALRDGWAPLPCHFDARGVPEDTY